MSSSCRTRGRSVRVRPSDAAITLSQRNAGVRAGVCGDPESVRVFQASITSTAIRYASLAEDPMAVVISQDRPCAGASCLSVFGICVESSGIWERLDNSAKLATAEFNREPKNIRAAREVEGAATLDEWLDGAPEIEVREDVVGLGRYRRTLTVLVSEEALPEEPNDDDK